jgi:hypothetical protein
MEKNKLQDTNNHPVQLTTTNKIEPLRHTETEGNNRRERQDSASPLIFVPGIRNRKGLTALIEQIVNSFNIGAWNADRLTQRMKDVEVFLNTQKTDILLVSEIHFTERNYVKIPTYTT